ncbi:MAG TPA: CvpA family protein [Bryobacteraceae bacterium]|jgi:membrane protein required for colicin V production|nr:CvpA family protein [Bryobacteraceae bacterium]
MPAFNWFDVALCFILLGSVLGGLRAGFARVAVGLVATIVGIIAGFWFYGLVGAKLLPHLNGNVQLANLLGFFTIFVGVMIAGAILAALLSQLFRWIGLSWFDHALGGVAGIVRGVLVVTVLVDVLVAFTPPPPPGFLNDSRVLPYTNQFSGWLIDIAPWQLKQSFERQMHTIEQFSAPASKTAHDQQA